MTIYDYRDGSAIAKHDAYKQVDQIKYLTLPPASLSLLRRGIEGEV
jgi:hypothetical protein